MAHRDSVHPNEPCRIHAKNAHVLTRATKLDNANSVSHLPRVSLSCRSRWKLPLTQRRALPLCDCTFTRRRERSYDVTDIGMTPERYLSILHRRKPSGNCRHRPKRLAWCGGRLSMRQEAAPRRAWGNCRHHRGSADLPPMPNVLDASLAS